MIKRSRTRDYDLMKLTSSKYPITLQGRDVFNGQTSWHSEKPVGGNKGHTTNQCKPCDPIRARRIYIYMCMWMYKKCSLINPDLDLKSYCPALTHVVSS